MSIFMGASHPLALRGLKGNMDSTHNDSIRSLLAVFQHLK
jgi:hypothetical protein